MDHKGNQRSGPIALCSNISIASVQSGPSENLKEKIYRFR